MRIQGARVAVTGGAGFIGSHLVDRLLAAGNEVTVLDDFSTGVRANLAHHALEPRLRLVAADVRDERRLGELFSGCHYVFHLATRNERLSLVQPTLVHDVNTSGTLAVLKAAAAAGVRRLLYCSSSEVDGSADIVPLGEDYPCRPATISGASKLAGEHYTAVFHRAGWLPAVIARPHSNYGPRAHYAGNQGEVIPRFILWALAGKPLLVHGDGRQTRDFTFVSETAEYLLRLLECDQALGQIVNVCRGQEASILEIACLVGELTTGHATVEHLPARPGAASRRYGDPARLQALLGDRPAISIRDGLARTIAWYREHVPSATALSALAAQTCGDTLPETWLEAVRSRRSAEAA